MIVSSCSQVAVDMGRVTADRSESTPLTAISMSKTVTANGIHKQQSVWLASPHRPEQEATVMEEGRRVARPLAIAVR